MKEIIEVYQADIVINRKARRNKFIIKEHKTPFAANQQKAAESKNNKRGKITQLTSKSRNRLAFVACNSPVDFDYMTTLTYPKKYPNNGIKVKGHLKLLLKWLVRKGGGEYLWFLEFQKRGAPHVHILHEHKIDKTELSRIWYKIVGSEDNKHLLAGTNTEKIRKVDGAKRYVVKYAYKTEQKLVPPNYQNVGRFWGVSKGAKPKKILEIEVDRERLLKALEKWSQYDRLGEKALDYRVLFGASYDVVTSLISDNV